MSWSDELREEVVAMLEGHIALSGPAVEVIRKYAKVIREQEPDYRMVEDPIYINSTLKTMKDAAQKILDQLPEEHV